VALFHRFIRDGRIPDDTLVDVADYGHVHHGPGVMLIGHAADHAIDQGEGRPGLLFSRKRGGSGDAEARLADAFRRTITAARLIEAEPGLEIRFDPGELLLRLPDRLNDPNSDETLARIRPPLEAVLRRVYAARPVRLEREGDPREPFTLRIRIDSPPSLCDLTV
jgi:hypothetical protein